MRFLALVALACLSIQAHARDAYLELRANAWLYEKPDRESDVVVQVKARQARVPVLLKLLSDKPRNGYYNVELVGEGSASGWIYKAYVRGHQGPALEAGEDAEGSVAVKPRGKGFELPDKLPFPREVAAQKQDVDKTCGPEGSGRGGKALSAGNRLQNRAKNNFWAKGSVVDLDVPNFLALQKMVDRDLKLKYGSGALPEDRAVLQKLIKVGGLEIGEGSLVRYAGFVHHPRNSNLSKGESVNCNRGGVQYNDIHIDIMRDPEAHVCSSITVEISPHYRPKLYNVALIKEVQDRPMRFTGQLFFDGSHKPCETPTGPGGNPKRITVWEIHPVYSIDVCKSRDLKKCKSSDASVWIPMHQAINTPDEDEGDED